MKLRLLGTEVRLSLALLPFLFACIAAGETGALACAVISLLLHECAHGIAARNIGCRVERLSVYPFGAVMELVPLHAQTGSEWIAAIAGPLGSFLIASAARLCMALVPEQTEWLQRFSETNLAIAVLNLLPAYPLDGGRIARQALLRVVRERTANLILLILNVTISAGLFACGILLFLRGAYAWQLLVLPPFLVGSAFKECRIGVMGPVRYALERQGTGGVHAPIKAAVIAVHPSITVGEAINEIRPTRYTILHVTDGERAFDLEEGQILKIAAAVGYQMPLSAFLGFDQPGKACYTKLFEKNPRIGEGT